MKDKAINTIYFVDQIQLMKIENLIGEFMAKMIIEKTRNKKQFDTCHVQPNLKSNQ